VPMGLLSSGVEASHVGDPSRVGAGMVVEVGSGWAARLRMNAAQLNAWSESCIAAMHIQAEICTFSYSNYRGHELTLRHRRQPSKRVRDWLG
jgi:hypothetical protein